MKSPVRSPDCVKSGNSNPLRNHIGADFFLFRPGLYVRMNEKVRPCIFEESYANQDIRYRWLDTYDA